MNTPVSFPLAKLLKEKGFDKPSIYYWFENTAVSVPTRTVDYKQQDWNKYPSGLRISAPTIAEVIMWLYEKHEIWVRVEPDWDGEFWAQIKSKAIPDARIGKWTVVTALAPYKSPTEAYEAAIKCCLNNLI